MSVQEKDARVNEQIRVPKIRLIGADGEMVGVVTVREALDMARDAGLDLVEVSPNAEPPVCKILDYGKYKYMQQKRANEARKKQKIIQIKEIKLRPTIDDHDLDVKLRSVEKFLAEGDKVKMTLRFRGREMSHQELGLKLLNEIKERLADIIKVDHEPRLEGRQMIMIVSPAKASV
jgi:translation initiation factor IF-3